MADEQQLFQPLAGNDLAQRITSKPWSSREYRGEGKVHAGIDFRAARGTPVYAIADGKVITAFDKWKPKDGKAGGNDIIIDHGNGVASGYMHLSKLNVKAGDQIKAGKLIGYTGDTGGRRANKLNGDNEAPMKPHLHFQIMTYQHGWTADPALAMPYFQRLTIDPAGGKATFLGRLLRRLYELKILVEQKQSKKPKLRPLPTFDLEKYERRQEEEKILRESRELVERWRKEQEQDEQKNASDEEPETEGQGNMIQRQPRLASWVRRRPLNNFRLTQDNAERERIRQQRLYQQQQEAREQQRLAQETQRRIHARNEELQRQQLQRIIAQRTREEQNKSQERERQRQRAAERERQRQMMERQLQLQRQQEERERQRRAMQDRAARNNYRPLNVPHTQIPKIPDYRKPFFKPDAFFPKQTGIYLTQVGVQNSSGVWNRTFYNPGKLLGKF